jgi:hypothetical protein
VSGDFLFGLGPLAFIIIGFAVCIGVTWLGYASGRRLGHPKNEHHSAALNTTLASIFVIVGLILSFSFSFAVSRYEDRWRLVVQEADAIYTTYLRADMLEAKDRGRLRSFLRRYVAAKIDYYSTQSDATQQASDLRLLRRLDQQMWRAGAGEPGTRSTVGLVLLVQSLNTMLELGADQQAALEFRLRGPGLILILIVSLVASFLIGLGFGQSGSPHWLVSALFCALIVALIFVIIDLDSPRAGFITVNLTPLYDVQQEMQADESMK